MRYLDEILNDPTRIPALKELLKEAVYIVGDDVAAFYYGDSKENYDPRTDYPNVAPPFPSYFIEFNYDGKVYTEGIWQELPFRTTGVFFTSRTIEEVRDKFNRVVMDERSGSTFDYDYLKKHRVKWLVYAFPFMRGLPVEHQGYHQAYFVTEDGHVCESYKPDAFMLYISKMCLDTEYCHAMEQFIHPGWLATSFLHCKNVSLLEAKLSRPERREFERMRQKGKLIADRHYTIDIKPMRKILSCEGGMDAVGSKRAMHICRGHFKDFSNGAGLFGKYKGIYWWESQVMGSEKNGKVTKDYNIKL